MNHIKHLLYYVTPLAVAVSVACAVAYPNIFDNGLGCSMTACGLTVSSETREEVVGWPFTYQREKEHVLYQAGSPPVASNVSFYDVRSLIGNVVIGVLMSCATFSVVTSVLRKLLKLQFRLETLLLAIGAMSVVLGVYQSHEVLGILLGRPIVVATLSKQSLLLTVPLVIGVCCLIYSSLWCVLRLIELAFKWSKSRKTSLQAAKPE